MTESRSDAPRRLSDYPIRTHDKLRYADTDKQGHVNNAVYATYFETGRIEFLDAAAARNRDGEPTEFVIAQLTVTYLQEVLWPGEVHVGSRVERVGNSSLTFAQGLFKDDVLCATAESVIVQIDTATRASRPFSPEMRQHFLDLAK